MRITKEREATIFIDTRPVEDKTVVLASKAYDDEGNEYIGVEYGMWKGWEALLKRVNLDIANMDLAEVVDEGEESVVIRDPETVGPSTG